VRYTYKHIERNNVPRDGEGNGRDKAILRWCDRGSWRLPCVPGADVERGTVDGHKRQITVERVKGQVC